MESWCVERWHTTTTQLREHVRLQCNLSSGLCDVVCAYLGFEGERAVRLQLDRDLQPTPRDIVIVRRCWSFVTVATSDCEIFTFDIASTAFIARAYVQSIVDDILPVGRQVRPMALVCMYLHNELQLFEVSTLCRLHTIECHSIPRHILSLWDGVFARTCSTQSASICMHSMAWESAECLSTEMQTLSIPDVYTSVMCLCVKPITIQQRRYHMVLCGLFTGHIGMWIHSADPQPLSFDWHGMMGEKLHSLAVTSIQSLEGELVCSLTITGGRVVVWNVVQACVVHVLQSHLMHLVVAIVPIMHRRAIAVVGESAAAYDARTGKLLTVASTVSRGWIKYCNAVALRGGQTLLLGGVRPEWWDVDSDTTRPLRMPVSCLTELFTLVESRGDTRLGIEMAILHDKQNVVIYT